ncbi:MAG TPA: hypothetical protein PKE06_25600 [Flavilitoribacter sp.]|nr:hypothetical protein [Flavilitoribacter sp.]
MNKDPVIVITLAALVLLLSGACGPTLYIPNTLNTPLLEKKNDFKVVNGFVSNAPDVDYDLQGAYAFSDHLAVMANFNFMNSTNDERENHHNLVEGGIGTYISFWPNRRGVNVGRAELFGGIGQGWARDQEDALNLFTGAYQRYFLQPGFGIRTRILDFTLGGRLSKVHFSRFQQTSGGQQFPRQNFGFGTYEPVLTIALGFKQVRFYWQFGDIRKIANEDHYNMVNGDGLDAHFNFGFILCPWKEGPLIDRPIEFTEEAYRQQEGEKEKDAPFQESRDQNGEIRQALIVPTAASAISVCLSDAGDPDQDIVNVSFQGAYLAQNLELTKTPACFDLSLNPGEDNLLYVEALTDGKSTPNTVRITVREGKKERTFFIRTDVGKVEEMVFRSR